MEDVEARLATMMVVNTSTRGSSVHYEIAVRLELEVRNVEVADGRERLRDGALAPRAAAYGAHLALHLSERAQHARAVEPLPLAVVAEAHARILPEGTRRPAAGP